MSHVDVSYHRSPVGRDSGRGSYVAALVPLDALFADTLLEPNFACLNSNDPVFWDFIHTQPLFTI